MAKKPAPSSEIGKLISQIQTDKNWSLLQLSQQVGISVGYLSMVKNGVKNGGPVLIAKLELLDYPAKEAWLKDASNRIDGYIRLVASGETIQGERI